MDDDDDEGRNVLTVVKKFLLIEAVRQQQQCTTLVSKDFPGNVFQSTKSLFTFRRQPLYFLVDTGYMYIRASFFL